MNKTRSANALRTLAKQKVVRNWLAAVRSPSEIVSEICDALSPHAVPEATPQLDFNEG